MDSASTHPGCLGGMSPHFAGIFLVPLTRNCRVQLRANYTEDFGMRYPSRLVVVVVCLFACLAVTSPAKAQAVSPTVYFSTGNTNPSQIYSLDTTSGATTLLVSASGADYEGLVVLPDNSGTDGYSYLIYACNTAGDQIIRFNPPPYANGGAPTVQTVYSGGGLYPQCGRGTSQGGLIVTSTNKGKNGGLFEFSGIAGTALGGTALSLTPTTLFQPKSGSSIDQGLAMKNIGDLLIVDQAGNQVLRSPGPISAQFSGGLYNSATPFITGLSSPRGIARATTGEIFVSNQSSGTVTKFDATGQNGVTCVSFSGNYTPYFMQMGLDNTLYVGATKNSKGEVLVVDAATCTQTNSFTPGVAVVGIALSPSVAVNVPAQSTMNNDGTFTYSFAVGDSSVFQVTTAGCPGGTPTATATETVPYTLSQLISGIAPHGGTPAVDLWADGFEIAFDAHFDTSSNADCQPIGGPAPPAGTGVYEETMSSFVDPSVVTSGTIVYCDGSPLACQTVDLFGAYPYGGLLPADYSGSGRTNSKFFVINATPLQSGKFCGYQSPLNGPAPPGIAGIFSSGSTISVKFKLATAGGSCKSSSTSNYITNAVALISVAQLCTPGPVGSDVICSANSQAVLNPSNFVSLVPEGNSTQTPPEFKFGNNQYQFSLSLKGYPPGIYSLTTTFLNGETTDQTVLFQVQ